MLKPQDVLIVLKILSAGQRLSRYKLGKLLNMSSSEVHAGIKRAQEAGLLSSEERPMRSAIAEFLVHGLPYVYPASLGPLARGVPTSFAVEPLKSKMIVSESEYKPVWPDPEGEVQGYSIEPLYLSASFASKQDEKLHSLLALVDAIRTGRTREREIAARCIEEIIHEQK